MTVCEEPPAQKRSRLSLKGVRRLIPKPTLDETTPLNNGPSTSSAEFPAPSTSTADLAEPRTPDQPIVIPGSPRSSPARSSPEKRQDKPVIASFNNLGNTCFLNSVLQILRYTPGFVPNLNSLCRELLNVHKQQRAMAKEGETVEASAPWRLVRCLQKLYTKMERLEGDFEEETDDSDLVIQPEKLLDTIRELNPMYEGNFQHDAQELLHCILCFIKDAVQELVHYYDDHPARPLTVTQCERAATTTGHTSNTSLTAALGGNSNNCNINITSEDGEFKGEVVDLTDGHVEYDESTCSPRDKHVSTDPVPTVEPKPAEPTPVEVKPSTPSLSSLSDAIGDVVITDDVTVQSDVADFELPSYEEEVTLEEANNNLKIRDDDELPPPQGGFPSADDLFGDESMDITNKSEGRIEKSTITTTNDCVHDTIDRVLRGETSVDWTRDWINENEENEFTFNFDNPSDALCEENRAIAESLKDAAAMASVASAISDGKLTPRTPKSSPVKNTSAYTSPARVASPTSPTTDVIVELCSQSSSQSTTLRRASTSSSAVRIQDEIEVLDEAEEQKVEQESQNVFAQPVGMRGGARRETKVAKRRKSSPPGPKVRKGRKPITGRGLSVCNGDVADIDTSPSKILDPPISNFQGKENIPMKTIDKEIFPKTYSRKRPQLKETVVSPVRRSPRKLNQKKDIEETQNQKLDFENEIVMDVSPVEDEVQSGEQESRKRVFSPGSENVEPKSKRLTPAESPEDGQTQQTLTNYFPKRSVVRRLGIHGAVIRKSKSPEKVVDLTSSQSQSRESSPPPPPENDLQTETIDQETPPSPAQEQTDIIETIETEETDILKMKQDAMDNALTVRVRLEKCDLKERYPDLKVSVTPPKNSTMSLAPCRLVENLFEGSVAFRTTCRECELSSDRVESFQDVSVPVKRQTARAEKRDDLSDDEETASPPAAGHWMLQELSEVEHLRDENKYFCEACHQLVEAERSTHYDLMPRILTLHLKRFAATAGFFGGLSKITDHVTIPLTLPCFSAKCTNPCSQHRYELYGLVMHSGVTITSGHYVSYVRLNRDVIRADDGDGDDVTTAPSRLLRKAKLEGRWIECDDDQIKVLSESDFENVLSESNFGTPYVLFYHLVDLC